MSTIANGDSREDRMIFRITNRDNERMGTILDTIDGELGPNGSHSGQLSRSSDPKLHGLLAGAMDNKLLCGMIVDCFGEDPLDVTSMP